jgi:hypothetical protein
MPLTKLQFRPGLNRESTSYANEGGWFNSDLIRFRKGRPEKLGGWIKLGSSTFTGIARSMWSWSTLDNTSLMALGTSSKFYLEEGASFNDITPIRRTASLGSNPFKTGASGASAILTVTDVAHGANEGSFVRFIGSSAVDGVTAAQINIEFEITSITNANSYTVTTAGTASSGDTSGGGSSVTALYQLNVGTESFLSGNGFGAGLFGGLVSDYSQTTLNDSGGINASVTSFTLTSASDFETASTTTTAALTILDTTLPLTSSSGFPDKGHVLIGSEVIAYDLKSGNNLSDLVRGADGTTTAAHNSGVAVTFIGLLLIEDELIRYTGKSSNTIDAGVSRGAFATDAASHSDGVVVKEANSFVSWGASSTTTAQTDANLRLWWQDNFGEDLIFGTRNGAPYYWDRGVGVATRATALSAQSGASNTPTLVREMILSTSDRHVVAFGVNPLGESTLDPLLVRWSDQESAINWTPSATNTSGDQRISNGSEIITARRTRQEFLIWTDMGMHSMRFIGPPYTFGFQLMASNVSIISPKAAINAKDSVFWMDSENFYIYSGRIDVLSCTVLRHVFDNINLEQRFKFFAASNRLFSEIFWFYVSGDATEIDRYVKFNYEENAWDIGELSRTAWIDADVYTKPRGASSNTVYIHETGNNDDESAMTSFIESSDFDLGEGDRFMFVNRLIPDVALSGSDTPTVDYILKIRDFPNASLSTNSTSSVTASTEQVFVRARGRQAALRIQSDTADMAWTLGDTRIGLRQDGGR